MSHPCAASSIAPAAAAAADPSERSPIVCVVGHAAARAIPGGEEVAYPQFDRGDRAACLDAAVLVFDDGTGQ